MQVWKIDVNKMYTGESYFVDEPSENEITTPITIGYVKPKWNGIEWIEGATEQEIQAWKDSQKSESMLPTQEERLKALEDAMITLTLGGM